MAPQLFFAYAAASFLVTTMVLRTSVLLIVVSTAIVLGVASVIFFYEGTTVLKDGLILLVEACFQQLAAIIVGVLLAGIASGRPRSCN